MKGKLTKKRYKAKKKSSCSLCKPYKTGSEDKKSFNDLRQAEKHEEELKSF
jgi:hypothetical protein